MSDNDSLAATIAAPSTAADARTFARSTVLPRRMSVDDAAVVWSSEQQPRYEAVRPLGEGGMGEVVLVHDHDIGRRVAVKRIKTATATESAVLRFAEEVRTVGELEHPGIVPVHDVGIDERGQHYLVMKYVEGETLEAIIERLRARDPKYLARFSYEERVRIFLAILHAVRYAHDKGVIHRDLKPANVMVGPFGEVMVMDWGIAKRIERDCGDQDALAVANTAPGGRLVETADGALLGTPLYMSPEQAKGKLAELDERSDIYSLCLMFYELLALQNPFDDLKSAQELIIARATRELKARDLAGRSGDAPCEYVFYLVSGLALDPNARFRSIAEMEDKLHAILRGKVPVTCPITLTKRVGQEALRWIDRHPLLYTAIFFVGVLSILASMVMLVVRVLG